MTDLTVESFTHTLIGDVNVAGARLNGQDSPSHRREFIRSTFAAVEGLHWQLKQDVLNHAEHLLSHLEYAAMAEETYGIDERGNVNATPRFLPLPTAIRMVVNIVRRYRPDFDCDFNHRGWSDLKKTVEVRNRLVHPKRIEDLQVSNDEIRMTQSALHWVLALVILALRANASDLQATLTAVSPQK